MVRCLEPTEPLMRLEILDCTFRLTGPQPQPPAEMPALSESRVEFQRTLDQTDGCVDILAKGGRYIGAAGENPGILTGHLKRSPGQVETVAAIRLRVTAPA